MSSEIDNFEDLMHHDHAGFGSLEHIYKPTITLAKPTVPGQPPPGVNVHYHCNNCPKENNMLISWAELYCCAYGVRPNPQVGINDPWQASADMSSFGPGVRCSACGAEGAPFSLGRQECRGEMEKYGFSLRDPLVLRIAPHVQNAARQQAAAAPQASWVR